MIDWEVLMDVIYCPMCFDICRTDCAWRLGEGCAVFYAATAYVSTLKTPPKVKEQVTGVNLPGEPPKKDITKVVKVAKKTGKAKKS